MATNIVRMRDAGVRPRAGAHDSSAIKLDSGWHLHDLHQLQYAFEGSFEIESRQGHFLIPPQLAAFIPAGLTHRTSLGGRRSGSVFLPPASIKDSGERIRILRVSPLMREMMMEAMRWPIDQPENEMGRAYFKTFALLCREWIENETALHLPTTDDPRLRKAMDHTQAHLADVRFADVCKVANLSERSLRRRFMNSTGMRWTDYRQRCQLLRAMTLLESERLKVSDVAATVGFKSVSAFSKAFKTFTGESPRSYRSRIASAIESQY